MKAEMPAHLEASDSECHGGSASSLDATHDAEAGSAIIGGEADGAPTHAAAPQQQPSFSASQTKEQQTRRRSLDRRRGERKAMGGKVQRQLLTGGSGLVGYQHVANARKPSIYAGLAPSSRSTKQRIAAADAALCTKARGAYATGAPMMSAPTSSLASGSEAGVVPATACDSIPKATFIDSTPHSRDGTDVAGQQTWSAAAGGAPQNRTEMRKSSRVELRIPDVLQLLSPHSDGRDSGQSSRAETLPYTLDLGGQVASPRCIEGEPRSWRSSWSTQESHSTRAPTENPSSRNSSAHLLQPTPRPPASRHRSSSRYRLASAKRDRGSFVRLMDLPSSSDAGHRPLRRMSSSTNLPVVWMQPPKPRRPVKRVSSYRLRAKSQEKEAAKPSRRRASSFKGGPLLPHLLAESAPHVSEQSTAQPTTALPPSSKGQSYRSPNSLVTPDHPTSASSASPFPALSMTGAASSSSPLHPYNLQKAPERPRVHAHDGGSRSPVPTGHRPQPNEERIAALSLAHRPDQQPEQYRPPRVSPTKASAMSPWRASMERGVREVVVESLGPLVVHVNSPTPSLSMSLLPSGELFRHPNGHSETPVPVPRAAASSPERRPRPPKSSKAHREAATEVAREEAEEEDVDEELLSTVEEEHETDAPRHRTHVPATKPTVRSAQLQTSAAPAKPKHKPLKKGVDQKARLLKSLSPYSAELPAPRRGEKSTRALYGAPNGKKGNANVQMMVGASGRRHLKPVNAVAVDLARDPLDYLLGRHGFWGESARC